MGSEMQLEVIDCLRLYPAQQAYAQARVFNGTLGI